MTRARHSKKEIEDAVRYAEAHGWTYVKGRGHCWGILRCPNNDAECRCGEFCLTSVWSTPRVPENEARKIRKAVDGCIHRHPSGHQRGALEPTSGDA